MPSATHQTRVIAELLAALERLLNQGETFTGMSVATLMSEAGMSRRTFYVYFDDKVGLIREVAADVIDELMVSGEAWWGLAAAPSRVELEAAITAMSGAYEPHRALMRAVAETATYDPAVAEIYDGRVLHAAERLEEHIRAGQAAGSIRAAIDAQTTAVWLTMLVSTGLAELPRPSSSAARARQLGSVTAIVWRTLYAWGQP